MSLVLPNRHEEAERFLKANPDTRAFHVVWTDLCGVQRGKLLRRDELVPAWRDGRFLPISAMVLDVTGQDVPETGLVFDEGDRDLLLWPVPGSMVTVPWSVEPAAQYIAAMHDLDGTPAVPDPRNLLARMIERFRDTQHDAGGRSGGGVLPDGPRCGALRPAGCAEGVDHAGAAEALPGLLHAGPG